LSKKKEETVVLILFEIQHPLYHWLAGDLDPLYHWLAGDLDPLYHWLAGKYNLDFTCVYESLETETHTKVITCIGALHLCTEKHDIWKFGHFFAVKTD
jgi:hypothetical protein